MEKIKLQLTLEKLNHLCNVLRTLKAEAGPTRKEMASRSILEQMGKKLLKKEIDKAGTQKPVKIDLMYYEADVLESILLNHLGNTPKENYEHWLIQTIVNDLNQKLA